MLVIFSGPFKREGFVLNAQLEPELLWSILDKLNQLNTEYSYKDAQKTALLEEVQSIVNQ